MALIELKHVVGGYGGAPILNGVNMAIEQSDIGVIVGPNGAGNDHLVDEEDEFGHAESQS